MIETKYAVAIGTFCAILSPILIFILRAMFFGKNGNGKKVNIERIEGYLKERLEKQEKTFSDGLGEIKTKLESIFRNMVTKDLCQAHRDKIESEVKAK